MTCIRIFVIVLLFVSCKQNKPEHNSTTDIYAKETIKDSVNKADKKSYKTLFNENTEFIAKGFDFPVGKPNAQGYYNAQKFQENNHLGDDWNGVGGGNSDLGNPIYAIANGYVSSAKDLKGGWGNVIRIIHFHEEKLYESVYAHCDSIIVTANTFVTKGEQIATIGNCDGAYYAHLHLEIRDAVDLDIGGGYSTDTTGYLNPTEFITKNR